MNQVSDSTKHGRKQGGRRKRISIAVLTIAILFCQLILSESFVSHQGRTTFSRIHGTFYSPTISKQSTRKPTKEGLALQQQSTRIVLAAAAASAATPSNDRGDSLSFSQPPPTSKLQRFRRALPLRTMKRNPLDALDKLILQTCIPSILNLAVVPLVNAVDTFYVGRLGVALMLAGQSAANQASFTIFFLIAFVPNITAPLVARAVASGNEQDAQERVCESIFLCNVLGMLGTLLLVGFPRLVLSTLLLPADAPAMDFAAPYLRWRALGMVPSLIGATGSAAYRGLLNTVTPLKVSLMTNAVNLVLDPLLIFVSPFSYVGAAMATAAAETLGGVTYIHLLLRRKLARWKLLLRPPSWKALWPLLQGGAAMLLRQLALNVGFLVATRRAQQMDPTGVSGAAYGITMQIYAIGIICLVGMQNAAAALVPSSRAKYGDESARQTADRLLGWSTLVGTILGVGQFLLLPVLVPLFSTLDSVKEAARTPTLIASFIHIVNGPVLAGEGILMGVGSYRALAMITMTYVASMMACLTFTPLGQRLDGIMWSILLSSIVQQMGVVGHYLKIGPLAIQKVNGSNESKRDAVTVEESAEDTTETAAPTNRSQ